MAKSQSYRVEEIQCKDRYIKLTHYDNGSLSRETCRLDGAPLEYEEFKNRADHYSDRISFDHNLNWQTLRFNRGHINTHITFLYNKAGQVTEIETSSTKDGEKNRYREIITFSEDNKTEMTYYKNNEKVSELKPSCFYNKRIPNFFAENAICPASLIPAFKPKL